jgi:16S rRNA G966 N2-methylase RsmD
LKEILDNKILNQDGIIILEHVTDVNLEDFSLEIIKQKKYADKKITFLKQK